MRTSIEALRFSPERYNHTKSILMDKYGEESEIIKAYNREILDLPVIPGIGVKRIHEFSERLSYCMHSSETMGKLNQVNRNVSMTLDKLPGIRGDLVRTNHSWESWNFLKLCEALRLWTKRNPLDSSEKNYVPCWRETSNKLFNDQQREPKQRGCVYCDDTSHVPLECPKISTVDDRRQFLAQHRLCFNCARGSHETPNCYSRSSCRTCKRRHDTYICDRTGPQQELALTTSEKGDGIFPVVNLKVSVVECCVLINTGAGSSYILMNRIGLLMIKPVNVEVKQVDMLMGTSMAPLET